ncbi:MAG: DNA mismatch repair endonuclease MutL [Planctomycetia bacterium]
MGRINVLPVSVVNRIAAGEVVERPASVVKELLENALDARPTRIDVTLEQGGIALVRVVDDGAGIEADDLPLAAAPHATSKLRVAEDLERIETLGFRGEALASVGEVARLVIRSRPAGGDAGAEIEVDNGRMGDVAPRGLPVGTTVEVHQLFAKVPARRAFLRAAATEWSHAAEAFVRTALAHPGVAMTLTHNDRRVHDLPATDSWRDRIGGLFGQSLADRLIDVEGRDGEVAVSGFVGRPDDDMASARLQHLFVAGRPFRDRSILHAVQEAYRGLLLSGRQPIVFLQLSIPPEMVDVNVHPAKMEVRFRDPSRLYRLVLSTLRGRFLACDLKAPLSPPAADGGVWGNAEIAPRSLPSFTPFPSSGGAAVAARFAPPALQDVALSQAVTAPAPWEQDCESPVVAPIGEEMAVQMHDRYIVVESPEGIEVIDQHALHERVLYERLRAAVAAGAVEVQRLLVPETVDLSPAELELVGEHADALARAGMRVEPFGGATVIVSAKPALAGNVPAATLVREVLGRLAASATSTGMLVDEILHGLACKAAIKAGDPLSQAEVDALVRDRRSVQDSHHCPHGRPTSLTLSRQELDRQFRRT